MGYIFESLRSLGWIEVTRFFYIKFQINFLLQDIATTENRKLEWVDEEDIDNSTANGITEVEEEKDEDDSGDDDELADER